MKRSKDIVWGLILIAVGIIWGGNALGLFDIDVFFDGWWTLFIIIPCLFGLFDDYDKKGNIIWLVIGVSLLLACNDVIDFDIFFKLLIPIIVVIIGLSLVFKNVFDNKFNKAVAKILEKNNLKEEYCATFSGQNIVLDKEEFKGTKVNAIFGGVKLDLREAIIKEDVVISACSIFGGIELLVPENVIFKVKSNSIFGGVDNKKKSNNEGEVTIYLNATCLFGGVEIKWVLLKK